VPVNSELSEGARNLLLACYTGAYILVDDENRGAYRELAEAGLMIPLHTFAHGRESAYRMTDAGVSNASSLAPLPAEAPSPPRSRAGSYLQRLAALLHGFRIRPVRAR
jgi:hypothetical protein